MAKPKMPGFRFRPTDVELIVYFLKRKVLGKKFPSEVIAELDLYKFAPWDLPDMSLLKTGDLDWYFFCPRGKKYSTGGRLNRATKAGYWKTTGKDRAIEHNNRVVGMIKTLVFHTGRAPKGDRTDWVMHEFRLEDKELADEGVLQDLYVICRVFQKEGPGPRNGAQYGKPYEEKEWETDEEIDPVAPVCALVPIQPSESHISVANDIQPSTSECTGLTSCSAHPSAPNNRVDSVSYVSELMPPCSAHPSEPNTKAGSVSCVSELMPSFSVHPSAPNNQVGSVSCVSEAPNNQVDDAILSLLDPSKEDDDALTEFEANNTERAPCSDPNAIFEELGDLNSLVGLGDGSFSFGQKNEYTTSEMLYTGDIFGSCCDHDFLELIDLETPQLWQNKHGSGSQDK